MAQVVDAKKGQGGDGSTLATMVEKTHENIPYECLEEERIPGSRIRFKLKIAEDTLAPKLKDTLREYTRQVSLPGFRKGKAPEHLVRKRFEGPAREETAKRMVPRLCQQFTTERSIEPISEPYLLGLKAPSKEGVTLELAMEIHPTVEITEDKLAGIAVQAHRVNVDAKYVDGIMEDLRTKGATYEPTTEAFKKGDALLMNCTVRDESGLIVEDRSAVEYYCTKVEEELPAEVAEALVGKAKGDVVSLKVTETTELGSTETVDYEVEVLEVKARVLPALDDDFAQDVGDQYATLADLRTDVEKRAAAGELNRQRQEAANEILAVLRERINFDLPRGLVENTAHRNIRGMEKNLNQYGMSFRDLDRGMFERYAQGTFGQARINVKNSLIIRTLSRHFNVEPTEENINAKLEDMARESGRKPLGIRAQLEARKQWDSFLEDLAVDLVIERLISLAKVEYKDSTVEELRAIQRQRQEEQAAILRGELAAVAEADRKYFKPDESEDALASGTEISSEAVGDVEAPQQ